MPIVKCTKSCRVDAPLSETSVLVPGAFWEAGDEYRVSGREAQEIFLNFPDSFEPVDDSAAEIRKNLEGGNA